MSIIGSSCAGVSVTDNSIKIEYAIQEGTVGLANFNVGFFLIKATAPVEYSIHYMILKFKGHGELECKTVEEDSNTILHYVYTIEQTQLSAPVSLYLQGLNRLIIS